MIELAKKTERYSICSVSVVCMLSGWWACHNPVLYTFHESFIVSEFGAGCFLGALAVCDCLLEGGGHRPCWCWMHAKVGSFRVLNQIPVSMRIQYQAFLSSR